MSFVTLAQLALRRTPGLAHGGVIPEIEVHKDVVIDAGWLGAYRKITGGVDDGVLPPCAPQVVAVDLHLQLLLDPRFPLPAVGMVHVDNVIEERRPLPATGSLAITARTAGHRPHDKGVVFDIVTEARVFGDSSGGEPPWRSVMTALVRDARLAAPQPRREADDDGASVPLSSSSIRVREDIGRRYGTIAGDRNPIHLWPITAKALGFPRAIAHGMWTIARSLNEVAETLPPAPRRIAVKFIRPVFLPSTIVVEAARAGDAVRLTVTPERPGAPHLKATIAPLV